MTTNRKFAVGDIVTILVDRPCHAPLMTGDQCRIVAVYPRTPDTLRVKQVGTGKPWLIVADQCAVTKLAPIRRLVSQ